MRLLKKCESILKEPSIITFVTKINAIILHELGQSINRRQNSKPTPLSSTFVPFSVPLERALPFLYNFCFIYYSQIEYKILYFYFYYLLYQKKWVGRRMYRILILFESAKIWVGRARKPVN